MCMRFTRHILIEVIATALAFCSCSTRKNSAATRQYQAFITRYNIYFNGDEHYRETLRTMERGYADDYTDILFPHPAEAKGFSKSPQPSGDFTRSIEKAQKAIQLRSIKKRPKRKSGKQSEEYKRWLKREEYNPFLHNAWMMMARSQYLNGDYAGAAATFYYVSRHFSWLPATVTEAQLWQARSYVAFDWVNEAEAIVKRIKPEQLTSRELRGLYDFVEADIAVRRKDYAGAIGPLQRAIKAAHGAQKTRLHFLLGQCYRQTGQRAEAFEQFKKAASGSGATYRTKLNARIAQSEVYSGKDVKPEVKSLMRLAKLGRNKKYLDQIHYAIGNLYLSRGDTVRAIDHYRTASEKSERKGIEKAINDITLGQLYYSLAQYDLAQPLFSSAIPQLPETYPDYEGLKRRGDVLDELAVYAQNVALQDSLLTLSLMSEDERLKVINKIIDELKKKEKEEAEEAALAEYEANKDDSQGGNGPNAPKQFQMNNGDDSWYFYNTATVQSGRQEFQRKWGSRKLEDNWRRRNKASFSFDDFETPAETAEADSDTGSSPATEAETVEADTNANDPHFPAYYLAQIPQTDDERATCHDIIQEGLYTMGSILKDKLEDFAGARKAWDRLIADYPDNVYRLDVYYNLYIMMMRLGLSGEAEHWRQLIISEFPESKYGVALVDPNYIDRLREMPAKERELYERSYQAYLDNDNATVHDVYGEMMRTYPLSAAMPKFMFLHALAYVTEKDAVQFSTTLRELLERYPETDITPMASSFLKGITQGRKLNEGSSNTRGMIWDMRLQSTAAEEGAETDEGSGGDFDFDPEQPHVMALVYATDSVNANQLLFEVARHNFNSFVVKDFDLEQLTFGPLGILLVKGFDNLNEARHYRTVMGRSTVLTLPEGVTPVIISRKNFEQLTAHGRTFDEYFRAAADANADTVEDAVLGPAEEEDEEGDE